MKNFKFMGNITYINKYGYCTISKQDLKTGDRYSFSILPVKNECYSPTSDYIIVRDLSIGSFVSVTFSNVDLKAIQKSKKPRKMDYMMTIVSISSSPSNDDIVTVNGHYCNSLPSTVENISFTLSKQDIPEFMLDMKSTIKVTIEKL